MIAAWMNPLWNTLDRRLLKKMYRQLGAEFDAFVEVCQDTGLLQWLSTAFRLVLGVR